VNRESVEATALEVDALVRQDDEAVAEVEYSPDPDVRLIRNIWARKGVLLERVRARGEVHVGALCLQ
jgi:hypothetical protein